MRICSGEVEELMCTALRRLMLVLRRGGRSAFAVQTGCNRGVNYRPLVMHQGAGMKITRLTNAHKSKANRDALVSFGKMAPDRSFFLLTSQRAISVTSAIGAKMKAEPWRDQTTPVAHLGMPGADGP